jgi:prepilin-type N-terminal cleavage/methylation domain-containing protein
MTRVFPAEAAGFTLIEILVSLAILGIILATFAQVLSGSLLSSRRIDSGTEALLFARSTMDRIGRDLPLRPGVSRGAFPGGGGWSLRIGPATVAGRPSANLAGLTTYLVELTVTRPPFSPMTLTSLRVAPLPAAAP